MHPLFGRPLRLLLYAFVAVAGGVLLALALGLLTPRPLGWTLAFAVPLALLEAFVVLSAWWVCRANPLAAPLRAAAAQSGAALFASLAWTGAGALWAMSLARWTGAPLDRAALLRDLAALFVVGIPVYLLSAEFHYLLLAFEASHAAERRALESQVDAREAELRALRAQLNPHFLFNSLNSINALVGPDPEGARRMCERLGEFLRRTLSLGAQEAVPLGEELALVDRYLDIEQVRFGDRLRVERTLAPEAATCRVPPLLLQPLVENAVKHGIQHCLEGGAIRLEARRENGRLVLSVDNPVDPDSVSKPGEGVGLANVRRRLEMFHARDGHLWAERGERRFRVTLELPAVDA